MMIKILATLDPKQIDNLFVKCVLSDCEACFDKIVFYINMSYSYIFINGFTFQWKSNQERKRTNYVGSGN